MSIFRDFFVKEKPVFTGITRGLGGFGFGGGGDGTVSPSPISATGGSKIPSGGYMYHVFVSDQNFEVTSGNNNIEFLLVGGGGGSFGSYAGGGGGGGVAHATAWPITPGTYPIVVGEGGTGSGSLPGGPTALGGNTTFNGVTALGGGGGSHDGFENPGPYTPKHDGGSGGGLGDDPTADAGDGLQPGQPTFGGLVSNYGNPGFTPPSNNGPGSGTRGGGGGGAGGGGGGPSFTDGIPGGAGQPFPAFPAPVLAPAIPGPEQSPWTNAVGPTGLFAGGGAGNSGPGGTAQGGPGGGGNHGYPGKAFTGGGSGGTHPDDSPTANGGKGICILRYSET